MRQDLEGLDVAAGSSSETGYDPEVEPAPERHGLTARTLSGVCAAGLAAGMGIGLGHFLLRPPEYTATALVTVSSSQVLDLNQLRWSQAMARMAVMPEVSGDALRSAGRADVAADPKRYLQVAAAPDAPVMSISARMVDAGEAQSAANAVAEGTKAFSDARQFPLNVQITQAARPTQARPGLMVRLVLGGALGFVSAVAGLLVWRDRRLVRAAEA